MALRHQINDGPLTGEFLSGILLPKKTPTTEEIYELFSLKDNRSRYFLKVADIDGTFEWVIQKMSPIEAIYYFLNEHVNRFILNYNQINLPQIYELIPSVSILYRHHSTDFLQEKKLFFQSLLTCYRFKLIDHIFDHLNLKMDTNP